MGRKYFPGGEPLKKMDYSQRNIQEHPTYKENYWRKRALQSGQENPNEAKKLRVKDYEKFLIKL